MNRQAGVEMPAHKRPTNKWLFAFLHLQAPFGLPVARILSLTPQVISRQLTATEPDRGPE